MSINEKITDYTASSGNPDLASLVDISEKIGLNFETRSITIQELIDLFSANSSVINVFKNNSGSSIEKGSLVYLDSESSGSISVLKVDSSYNNDSKIFVAKEDILNGNNGNFIYFGLIEGIDTSLFTLGSKIYWNPSTLSLSDTSGSDEIFAGICLVSNVSGSIYFAPQREKGTAFNLNNSVIDAGDNKTDYIERYGSIKLKNASALVLDRDSDGVSEVGTFASNSIQLTGNEDSSGSNAFIYLNTYSPFNVYSLLRLVTINGTKAIPLATNLGKILSDIQVRTFDGSNYIDVITEKTIASENFTLTNRGVSKLFQKINSGEATLSDILEFTGSGNIRFNDAYQFPTTDGSNGQILRTDGAGNLSFVDYAFLTGALNSPSLVLENDSLDYLQLSAFGGLFLNVNRQALGTFITNSAIYNSVIKLQRKRGTKDLPSPAVLNDSLGRIDFSSEGTNVRMEVVATENQLFPTSGGSKLSIKSVKTGDNYTNLNERISIEGNGKIRIAGAYELPDVDGTIDQVLKTDGSGSLSWSNAGGGGSSGVAFSPINVAVCDTAPTSGTTQYYYQTIAEITGTISKAKLWGFSGSDNVLFGIYRGQLSGAKTLIGQGSLVCGIGSNEITLIAEAGQTLDLTAGEDIVVGFYPAGTSWRTVYDTGISDSAFGITNTANISTMPSAPTGTATAIRFALTLY